MMTGKEFLTGVMKWFRFQKENFQKAEETAGVLMTR
jgi:hypothetical protein